MKSTTKKVKKIEDPFDLYQLPDESAPDTVEYWKQRAQKLQKELLIEKRYHLGNEHSLLCLLQGALEIDSSGLCKVVYQLCPEWSYSLIRKNTRAIQLLNESKEWRERKIAFFEEFPWEKIGVDPAIFPNPKENNMILEEIKNISQRFV